MAIAQSLLDELWDFSDPVGSEARLRTAADEQTVPTSPPRAAGASRGASGRVGPAAARGELATQVARALGLQERFDDAHAVLDRIDVSDDVIAARSALERGRLHNSAGDRERALPYFLAAADAASAAGHVFLRVDALHMLAIAQPDQAEEWTAAALDVLDGVDDPRTLRWRVSLHNNAGWAHFDAGRVDEALASFERSRDAATRWGTPQQVQWADEAIAEARAQL